MSRFWFLIYLLAIAAMVVAGCGDNESSESSVRSSKLVWDSGHWDQSNWE